MFERLAPSEIAAKLIGIGARRDNVLREPSASPRFSPIAAVLPLSSAETFVRPLFILATAGCLLFAGPAFAQVEDPLDPLTAVPSLDATSPLGMGASGSVGTTGIPLGSTEVTSLGVSPAPTGGVTGSIAIPTTGAITSSGCLTGGMSPSGTFGSTASYDGGGMAPGTAAPATAATMGIMGTLDTATTTDPTAIPGTSTSSQMSIPLGVSTTSGVDTSGMSGMCGSGSSSIASSSTPTSTSPTVPGGFARTGIPLGSTEIANLGVSSAPAVPTVGVLPIVGTVGPSAVLPTMPIVSSSTTAATCGLAGATGAAGTGSGGAVGEGTASVSGSSIPARLLRDFILCQRQPLP